MTALHFAAGVAVCVALTSTGIALSAPARSESRAVFAIYGWICGMAAVVFYSVAWWVTK